MAAHRNPWGSGIMPLLSSQCLICGGHLIHILELSKWQFPLKSEVNPHILLVGLQIGIATVEKSMEVSQKTKHWSTIWSSNLFTGYLPQRTENSYLKRYLHTSVHSSVIHSGQDIETTGVSYDRWLDKEAVLHIYNGILLSHKKRWNTAIYNNTGGSWDYHTKQNELDRKYWESHDFTHM